jgi:UrcA family protein
VASQPPQAEERPPEVIVGARRDPDVPSKRVRLSDLDLSTDVGACTALRRIKRAADEVCPFSDERELSLVRMQQECKQESVARAVHDTRAPKVQSLLDKKAGGC